MGFGFGVQNKCQKSCQVSGLTSMKMLSIPVCLVCMGCRRGALLLSSLPASQTSSHPLPSLQELCLIFKGRVWVKLPGRCAVLSEREVGIEVLVRGNIGWFFGGMIPALFY